MVVKLTKVTNALDLLDLFLFAQLLVVMVSEAIPNNATMEIEKVARIVSLMLDMIVLEQLAQPQDAQEGPCVEMVLLKLVNNVIMVED